MDRYVLLILDLSSWDVYFSVLHRRELNVNDIHWIRILNANFIHLIALTYNAGNRLRL